MLRPASKTACLKSRRDRNGVLELAAKSQNEMAVLQERMTHSERDVTNLKRKTRDLVVLMGALQAKWPRHSRHSLTTTDAGSLGGEASDTESF